MSVLDISTSSETIFVFPSIGLAVDDVGGRIYWTDAGDQNIQSSDLSGANIQIFLALDEDAEPSAITVTESWVCTPGHLGVRLLFLVNINVRTNVDQLGKAIDRLLCRQ